MFTACGIVHQSCCLLVTKMKWNCSSTSSWSTEDGRNYRTKHVELIEIVNKIIIVASSWLFILFILQLRDYMHMNTFFVTADFKDMFALSPPFIQNYRPDLTNVQLFNFPTHVEKSLNFRSHNELLSGFKTRFLISKDLT